MFNGLRILKHKGFTIPEACVKQVLELYPTALGMVSVEEGGEQSLEVEHYFGKDVPSVAEFMTAQENYKEKQVGFFFAHSKDAWPAASMQPLAIITDADDKVTLAAIIEGEVIALEDDVDKDETDEYNLVKNVIGPTLEDLWERHNGDMAKILASCKEKLFQGIIKNGFINRGVCDLYFAQGSELIVIPKGQLGQEFPWGRISSPHFRFEEKSFPEQKEEKTTTKKASFLSKTRDVVVKAVTGSGKEGKSIEEAVKDKDAKTDTSAAAIVHSTRPMIGPPQSIIAKGKRTIEEWYKENCTLVPEGFKNGPKAPANDEWIAKHIGKDGAMAFSEGLEVLKNSVMAAKPGLAIIDAKNKGILTELINSKDVQAKVGPGAVLDVDKMKAETSKIGSFTEQLGLDEDILLRADHEIYCLFGKKAGIEVLAAVCCQLRNKVIDLNALLNDATEPEKKPVDTKKNPGDEAAEAEAARLKAEEEERRMAQETKPKASFLSKKRPA